MPAGLQVWDETGKLTFDTNYRTARTIGIVQPGLGTTVYTDGRLTEGTPWAFYCFEGFNFAFGDYDTNPQMTAPIITFSGNQMIVTRRSPPAYMQSGTVTVYFGVR